MAVIYLQPDPNQEAYNSMARSAGGMLARWVTGGTRDEKRKKGMMELAMYQEHGGFIPADEMDKLAKKLDMPIGLLTQLTEPVIPEVLQSQQRQPDEKGYATNFSGGVPGYKFVGKAEQAAKDYIKTETMKKRFESANFREKLAETMQETEGIAAATVRGKQREEKSGFQDKLDMMRQEQIQTRGIKRTQDILDQDQQLAKYAAEVDILETYQKEMELWKRSLPMTEAEKAKYDKEMSILGLREKQLKLNLDNMKFQASEKWKKFEAFKKSLSSMGFTERIKVGTSTTEVMKKITKGSDEDKELRDYIKANGYEVIESDLKDDWFKRGDQILVGPKIPDTTELEGETKEDTVRFADPIIEKKFQSNKAMYPNLTREDFASIYANATKQQTAKQPVVTPKIITQPTKKLEVAKPEVAKPRIVKPKERPISGDELTKAIGASVGKIVKKLKDKKMGVSNSQIIEELITEEINKIKSKRKF